LFLSTTPPHTHNSSFYKLTTFAIVKLFFLYDLPTIKTLYDVTRSCCCTTPPLSHTQSVNTKRRHRSKHTKKHKRHKNKHKKRQTKKTKKIKQYKQKKKEENNRVRRKW
jgi:hypothetical protein